MFSSQQLAGLAVLALPLVSALPQSGPTPHSDASDVSQKRLYFFNFGDSYTATGFNLSGEQPHVGDPMGNPPPEDDFAGGPGWVAWLTTTFNKTLVLDYDLGFGGATINQSIVPTKKADVRTYLDQVETEFKPHYASKPPSAPWTSDTAIFSICLGINDVGFTYQDPATFDKDLEPLLDSYFNLTTQLYNTGARKFLFINTPPTNRSHAQLSLPAAQRAAHGRAIVRYNTALQQRIAPWTKAHPGASSQTYDYFGFMSKVLDHPQQYGFANATCDGNGQSDCVWWNTSPYHTTSHFQRLLAQNMVSSLTPLGW